MRYVEIAQLAHGAGQRDKVSLPNAVQAVVPHPLPVQAAYEIVLQSYLFFGYPQAIEALKQFRGALRDMSLDAAPASVPEDDATRHRLRGEALCERIYKPNYRQLQANMRAISPELAEWMIVEGYGKVLSRSGPTALEREIASVIFLCCSGHEVQLYSHVRGARNLGADRELLEQVTTAVPLTPEQRALAMSTIAEVFDR